MFQECLVEMLQDMFGDEAVPTVSKSDTFVLTVNGKKATINLAALVTFDLSYFSSWSLIFFNSQEVECAEDSGFQQVVQTAVLKLYQSLSPAQTKVRV